VTWFEWHKDSERLATDAEIAVRQGDLGRAKELYVQAAVVEKRALKDLDSSKSRTIGISAVSTVSLYYKASELAAAEAVACRWLTSEYLPDFAAEQLRALLQSIWSEQVRENAEVVFAPGQVVVSVKGGEIVEGGAPLDLIVEKVQTVQSLFYRTAELLRGLPHRKRGLPPKEIQETCRPWLFQTTSGSYQFAVAVEEPRQSHLFNRDDLRPKEVSDQFLKILRASAEAPEDELPELVPDSDYRSTFLKLTRSLAPTGKRFSQLDIRSATETRTLTLVPSTREAVRQAIRASRTPPTERKEEQTIRGLLRALHLDKDWIEITVGDKHTRVTNVGEVVDDIIGPMVNHPVIVQVVRDARGKFHFLDIESDN